MKVTVKEYLQAYPLLTKNKVYEMIKTGEIKAERSKSKSHGWIIDAPEIKIREEGNVEFLTVAQYCEKYEVTKREAYRRIHEGEVNATKSTKGSYIIAEQTGENCFYVEPDWKFGEPMSNIFHDEIILDHTNCSVNCPNCGESHCHDDIDPDNIIEKLDKGIEDSKTRNCSDDELTDLFASRMNTAESRKIDSFNEIITNISTALQRYHFQEIIDINPDNTCSLSLSVSNKVICATISHEEEMIFLGVFITLLDAVGFTDYQQAQIVEAIVRIYQKNSGLVLADDLSFECNKVETMIVEMANEYIDYGNAATKLDYIIENIILLCRLHMAINVDKFINTINLVLNSDTLESFNIEENIVED